MPQRDGAEHREDPGLGGGRIFELIQRPERAKASFLDEILCISGGAREPERGSMERRQVRQDLLLKPLHSAVPALADRSILGPTHWRSPTQPAVLRSMTRDLCSRTYRSSASRPADAGTGGLWGTIEPCSTPPRWLAANWGGQRPTLTSRVAANRFYTMARTDKRGL